MKPGASWGNTPMGKSGMWNRFLTCYHLKDVVLMKVQPRLIIYDSRGGHQEDYKAWVQLIAIKG